MTRPFAAAKLAALVYMSVIVIVVGVALVAGAVLDQQTVEDLQRVPFPRLPMSLGEAASIWMHNGRILLAAVGAAVAVNAPWLAATESAQPQIGWGWRATRALCDAAIVVAAGRNLVTVGVGLAVWRDRMLLAILPHGLVELAAFACGLALYLHARRGPVERPVWSKLVTAGVVLLAIAALLEVFVVL
jgi:hypothetical protein